jgi:phage/plasmid primase-like uncharacterized protein
MTPAEIAKALGGRREGRAWRCPCPVHGGRSLLVTDRRGKTLFNCKAGCEQGAVLAALCNLGLFGRERVNRECASSAERERREAAWLAAETERLRRQIDRARALYRRAVPGAGTPVERYLHSRGITLLPECLRFLLHCPHRNGRYFPAMLAPVLGVTGQLIGLHKTFLREDGLAKADLPAEDQREFIGPVCGGGIQLAQPREGEELIIAEGIETALSCTQMFNLPAWSAMSAPGLASLELPSAVHSVLICADHDRNAVGLQVALDAKGRWASEGRAVRIRWPRIVGTDFNHLLQAEVQ